MEQRIFSHLKQHGIKRIVRLVRMRSRWLRFFIKQYFFKKLFLDGHFGYDMACGMADLAAGFVYPHFPMKSYTIQRW